LKDQKITKNEICKHIEKMLQAKPDRINKIISVLIKEKLITF
jgi:hypothetical protein